MNNISETTYMKRFLLRLTLSLLVFGFYSCKKDESFEKKLIGTWELYKITFLETNTSFPLDAFRNVFSVNLTLNGDFSFNETEDIGGVSFGPLGGTTITEHYNSPRNTDARYLIYDYIPKTWPTSRSFSIKQDSIIFKIAAQTQNSIQEEAYARKFNFKNNNELDIERLDLLVFNKQNNAALPYKLKFSYRRK